MHTAAVFHRAFVASILLGAGVPNASAQAYPARPIQLMIASPPGGGTDAIGRVLADALSAAFKQTVVPVNRAGASGSIASDVLVRSAPDGYTLLVLQNGHTVNPATVKKLPYDTFNDFTPIATLGRSPLVVVGGAQTNVKTIKELTALGKLTPASMSFAAAEASTRLATEMISGATGVPMTAVYYKGTGPAMTDVAGGHINFSVTTIASTLPFRGAGRVNYIGVMSAQRSGFLPEVPTLAEQGLPNIESSAWWGVAGPAGLPRPIVQKLNDAIRAALNEPEVLKRLRSLSIEPWASTPDEFDRFIRNEVDLNLKLAKKAGLEPE